MNTSSRHGTWRVAALLFASGFCALVYQIGWVREFRLIFGASTAASAAVLAIFIGGLGLGGIVLGPRADRHPQPLRLYAILEGIVAASAAASPLLLSLVRQLYIVAGGTPRLGVAGGTIARLVLSALVLAIPTFAMGGTLPAAARTVTLQNDARRRDVAALYGLNTFGAVTGCLLATFFMLETFGTRDTLWLAACLNGIVAVVANKFASVIPTPESSEPVVTESSAPDGGTADAVAPVNFVLTASAVVGFAFFLMELVWYRMLGPILGGSVFTFGLILAVALVGIAAGGMLYARAGANRPATLGAFAGTCLLEAAAIAGAYAIGDRFAMLALVLTPLRLTGFAAQVFGWTIVTAAVVLPTAFISGYQFPMLIALFGRGRDRLGRQIGLAYAANTVGAIVGSLAGGFGLLPWLSAPGAWRLVAVCLVALGLAAAWLDARRTARLAFLRPLALTAATVALLTATGPTAVWRHSAIGAGRASIASFGTSNQLREWERALRRLLVWDGDGVETSVALTRTASGYAFIVNGKSDGAAVGDAATQVMLGLLGAMLHPKPERSLVIGLGTGSTAGWLGVVPTMQKVDVVELEPLILDVARACETVNQHVLDNPKVHVTIGDAREWLLVTPERYDVIASEPSNPFRAGVASLFTREYYQAASDRLTADGMFIQWLQAYEVDAPTVRTVYATLASVFPHVETWQTALGDLAIVAAKHPLQYRTSDLEARASTEPYKTALRVAWRAVSLDGMLAHYIGGDPLARAAATSRAPVNEDDRNVVEFGFARSVGRTLNLTKEIREFARTSGASRASFVEDRPVDWDAVQGALMNFYAGGGAGADVVVEVEGSPDERARRSALLAYYGAANTAGARDAWHRQPLEPRELNELVMMAAVESQAASDAAPGLIERLRTYSPGEADTLLAALRIHQKRDEDAVAALEAAFATFRADPWSQTQVKGQALSLAQSLAMRTPALAKRLAAALDKPFAAGAQEETRLTTLANVTHSTGFAETCQKPIGAFEPHTPWETGFLTLRRDCYAATSDPRLAVAERELNEYAAAEPMPFRAGLRVEPPVPQVAQQPRP